MNLRSSALLAVVLLAGCDVLNPMQNQEKQKTYRPSDFWPDTIGMRPPPPGTVAAAAYQGEDIALGAAEDGRPISRIPVKLTPEMLQLGRKKFEVNCAVCHGLLGDGDSLVAKNMAQRPPPSLHQRVRLEDGHYYQVISSGFGIMPSYAGELTVEERWAVVAYVRALQLSQRARLDQAPPEVRTTLESQQRELSR
jgi:mono/diheme cytochrome c family protein